MADQEKDDAFEAMYERAYALAEVALEESIGRADDETQGFVAIAMIEAAVAAALEYSEAGDIAEMLKDLARQIEEDIGDEDDD